MKPVNIVGANLTLMPPEDMDDCEPLQVLKHARGLMSCWEVSPEDLAAIQRTGKIYLNVLCPDEEHPPVWISTDSMTESEQIAAAAQRAKATIH